MKRIICLVITLTILVGAIPMSVSSKEYVTVVVDGAVLHTDQPAEIINGRTMVPLRAIFEALGADVEWVEESQEIISQKDNVGILLGIGNALMGKFDVNNATANDIEYVEIDVAPIIKNGKTLVPARAVAEAYDCDVEWDEETQTVIIEAKKGFRTGTYSDGNLDTAFYTDGILYYTIGNQSCVYTYGGNEKQTYYTGCVPIGLSVYENYLYYFDKNDRSLYRIDMTTGNRESLAAGVPGFSQYWVYGDILIIIAENSNGNDVVYSYDSLYRQLNPVYTYTLNETDKGYFESVGSEDSRYLKIVHNTHNTDNGEEEIIAIAIDMMDACLYKILKSDSAKNFTTSDFGFDNGYVYMRNEVNDKYTYSKTNLTTSETYPSNQEEFSYSLAGKKNADTSTSNQTNISYSYNVVNAANVSALYRSVYMDGKKQMDENLYISALNPLLTQIYMLHSNSDFIVFEERFSKFSSSQNKYVFDGARMMMLNKETLKITEIDFYSTTPGGVYASGLGGTSTYTGNSWSNSMGGGLNSYTNSGTSGGATIETAKKCSLCNGSGQMKCNMCGGDGMMPSLVQFGLGGSLSQNGTTEEPCRYCSGGTKQCLACGGDGVIQ